MDFENQEIIHSEALFCGICDKLIEISLKCSHLKALPHEEFDRLNHMELTFRNLDKNETKDRIETYFSEHDKKR